MLTKAPPDDRAISQPSTLTRRLKVSINPDLIDKNVTGDVVLFTHGWVNQELTPAQLLEEIKAGRAYCAQLSGARRAAHFLASDVASVDIDGTRTIESALNDPIVEKCATIIYTTPSHTSDAHRFRVVFALPRTSSTPRR
jgi:hypothetical protein